MSNPTHVEILLRGAHEWNQWRMASPDVKPDLSDEDLSRLTNIRVSEANFDDADLSGTNFDYAYLRHTSFRNANLDRARCHNATFIGANLSRANVRNATLKRANFHKAICEATDFTGSDLSGASLDGADLTNAILDECVVYGSSAWRINGIPKSQKDLRVTPDDEPAVTADSIEVAQFIYTLLSNSTIRDVIDTVGKKAVLILGRFSVERKFVLDALRESLRQRNYVPLMFDFDKATSQTTIETILTLAHLSRFIIADLTDAKAVIQELQAIVPNNPSVIVQPVIETGSSIPGMFDFISKFPWVLPIHGYANCDELLVSLDGLLIAKIEYECVRNRHPD